jgi:murein DD-endopeptidase MepM/ murein hydrolase activator NlpD
MNPRKSAVAYPAPRFRTLLPGLAVLAALAGAGCQSGGSRQTAAAASVPAPAFTYDTLTSRIKVGESFNSIARNSGLPASDASSLLSSIKENFRFKLYAGQSYKIICRTGAAGRQLDAFILEDRYSDRKHVLSRPPAEGPASASAAPVAPASGSAASLPVEPAIKFGYSVVDIPVRTDTVAVSGSLSNNLYEAFVAQGETGALIQQVTKIFAWDLDFFKDPRSGDAFSLLVEKKFGEDGSFRGYGQVLSAKYVNRGREFFGILYKGSYFNQEGRSLEKMLMKAPLNFARVSSGFSTARLHPVLGVTRPHWGIDYAGPLNTKILAAGDGVVEYTKWVNGYGKTLKIRHNGVYNTYYAHLNGFAPGMGAGRRVKQGDIIAYMGRTGLATGVHLDYRVEYQGRYINPASLKMESKQGVEKEEWKGFCDHRDILLARMSTAEFRHFASVGPGKPGPYASEQAAKAF